MVGRCAAFFQTGERNVTRVAMAGGGELVESPGQPPRPVLSVEPMNATDALPIPVMARPTGILLPADGSEDSTHVGSGS